MVQYHSRLNDTFGALADPTRREILQQLGEGAASISDLAGQAGMTLTGIRKHVAILEAAGLVASEKVGRTRLCRLGPGRLDDATDWIEQYRLMWEDRFDRLEQIIERRKQTPKGPAS